MIKEPTGGLVMVATAVVVQTVCSLSPIEFFI